MSQVKTPGLLYVQTDVDPQHEDALNHWYDSRHMPQRKAVPGFLDTRRYRKVEGMVGSPSYLALYDLESTDVLQSDPYKALSQPPAHADEDRAVLRTLQNTLRAVMQQISSAVGTGSAQATATGAVLVVGLEPEPAYEEEYNAWYDEEHIPWLLPVPGVLRARRFRGIEGPLQYLAVYNLAAPEIRHSEAFEKAIDTPWSARMRRHCVRRVTGIYRPLEAKR
ncbi:MAG: hypothetical protein ACR2PL_11395 [Dehalococcoidia bacterium]